jgi:DMSO reductase anchor subunit
MAVSHWYHMNTYLSLAIIVTMLGAAVVFSMRRAKRFLPLEPVAHDHHGE